MAAFVRRFTSFPSIETLAEIEAVDIVDLPPPAPTTGVGSGTLCIFGEFEDGPFAAGGDASEFRATLKNQGIVEAFGAEDLRDKFGGFGFTYSGVPSNNPCARKHLLELWNGNGFLKLKYLMPRRLVVARVDTSVGNVAFSPLAYVEGGAGPYALSVGHQLTITTDAGGPANSTAIAAVVATNSVGAFAATAFVGGETISIGIDNNPAINVVFSAADQTRAQVAARINQYLGYTAATDNAVGITIVGIVPGTAGKVVLADVTPGALLAIGKVAGTTNGTGNVANLNAVTATEVATIVNGTVALTAIDVNARVSANGRLRIVSTNVGVGTINVTSTAMSTAIGITPVATTVAAGVHAAGTIPAGTRVRTAGGAEWVTMQTLEVEEGTTAVPNPGPHVVKVRPATDNGTAAGASASTVVVIPATDQPTFGELAVTNPAALTAALTEVQMDNAYIAAMNASIDLTKPSREANYTLSARRSDAIHASGLSNAVTASAEGHFGRKFIYGAPIGFTQSQAIADVALQRSDRLFYCWPGWRVRIPEIAERGLAGGEGFTADGVITVRGEGPLASLDCQLAPEENPGQQTGLIQSFFEVEPQSTPLGQANYISLKANGICAPRVDRVSGSIYQSGVTSSLTAGLTTQARRKMADFIQDTLAERLVPFSKKLATQIRVDSITGVINQFLSDLLAENTPQLQRIAAFSVDAVSGNTPSLNARGIFVWVVRVQTLASLDAIVVQTEIGEGVVTVTEVAA